MFIILFQFCSILFKMYFLMKTLFEICCSALLINVGVRVCVYIVYCFLAYIYKVEHIYTWLLIKHKHLDNMLII